MGFVAGLIYLLILIAKTGLSLRYAQNEATGELELDITIVQAILSGDPYLAENLKHNLDLSLRRAQFLWLVDEDDPLGQTIAQELEVKDSRVRVIICPPVPQSINPKAFKLELALKDIKTEYFAVLDDDTLLSADSIPKSLCALQNATVVTGLPYYLCGEGFWASLLASFVNNNSILTYLPLLNFSEPLSINGMFYVMRTADIKLFGGFKAVWYELSDDFAVARLVKKHGGRLVQLSTPQAIRTSVVNIKHYVSLMHRWFVFAQFQVSQQKTIYKFLLLFFLGLPPLFLWLLFLSLGFAWSSFWFIVVVLLIRQLVFIGLHYRFFKKLAGLSLFSSVLSELLQVFHMVHALLSKRILWRNRRIKVVADGSFRYIDEQS